MIHIGFTGTQRGMTEPQCRAVGAIVSGRDFCAHHGDCVGADAQFHEIARRAGGCRGIVAHPCDVARKRAHCQLVPPYDAERVVKRPLARNRDIVAESDCVIAAPSGEHQQIRSGTWATIRCARQLDKPLAIVLPSGALIYDGPPWP